MLNFIGVAFFCVIITPFINRAAFAVGLVDKPDARKQHSGTVAPIGGLIIYLGLLLGAFITDANTIPPLLLALGLVVLLLGILDDFFKLSARLRILTQMAIGFIMVAVGDIRIESLGGILGGDDLVLNGIVSIVFTVICIVGVLNAINMIDGLDGLSGSILLVSVIALISLSMGSSDDATTYVLTITAATLFAFLVFNSRIFRSRALIFLGDSGSMLVGLVLVWYLIEMTQTPNPAMSPAAAGWILGIPLLDTVSTMLGRITERRSPFEAGRDHLHHRLLDTGLSVNQTVLVMLFIHGCFVVAGILFSSYSALLFWIFVSITVVYFISIKLNSRPQKVSANLQTKVKQ